MLAQLNAEALGEAREKLSWIELDLEGARGRRSKDDQPRSDTNKLQQETKALLIDLPFDPGLSARIRKGPRLEQEGVSFRSVTTAPKELNRTE